MPEPGDTPPPFEERGDNSSGTGIDDPEQSYRADAPRPDAESEAESSDRAETQVDPGDEPEAVAPDHRRSGFTDRVRSLAGSKSWKLLAPIVVVLLAGFIFLFRLSTPPALIFDEVYYARDARSHRVGSERLTAKEYDTVAACDRNQYPNGICSWVHAPLGNYLIALGELAGPDRCPSPTDPNGNAQAKGPDHCDPFDWRIAAAIAGIVTVALVIGLGFLLFGSWIWASLTGLLVTLDGLFLTSSRAAMLDIFLAMFLTGAFLFLVLDRKLARSPWAPYRFISGALFGLAASVKWSAVLGLVAAILLVISWVAQQLFKNHKTAEGAEGAAPPGIDSWRWWFQSVFPLRPKLEPTPQERAKWPWIRQTTTWVIALCVLPLVVYVCTWIPWLVRHQWSWTEFVALHEKMYHYHSTLRQAHSYASSALSWIFLKRPVAYYFVANGNLRSHIVNLGNPAFWGLTLVALIALVVYWFRNISRLALAILNAGALLLTLCLLLDSPTWLKVALVALIVLAISVTWLPRLRLAPAVILTAYLAMYVPWLFQERTKFLYYMLPLVPFMAYAFVWATRELWVATTRWQTSPLAATGRTIVLITYSLVLIAFMLFYPVWTALPISAEWWHNLMWLRSWI